jgi:hypothetical protein
VLKRKFGPKSEELYGGWRRLHNEKLHKLHASPNIITVIKSRKMRLNGRIERMGESTYKILFGKKPEVKRIQNA